MLLSHVRKAAAPQSVPPPFAAQGEGSGLLLRRGRYVLPSSPDRVTRKRRDPRVTLQGHVVPADQRRKESGEGVL